MGAIDGIERLDQSFAIVTPSYLPDLKRCELLAESLDRTVPGVPHYLIVDRHDRAAFRHLERGNRRLIESEAILGAWILRLPGPRGIWLSLRALPVRGWIIQQILKIGVIEAISERTLIFCDSDTAFFRKFSREDLLVEGKVGLLDVEYHSDSVRRWDATARRLLGLSVRNGRHHNYVGNMICWHSEIVKAMQQKIETRADISWKIALARTPSFSEYMIYGTFVRDVLGYDNVDHAPSSVPLVKASWGLKLDADRAMDAFFSELDPRTIAVMIHSKDGIAADHYRPYLERLWKISGLN